MVEHKSNKGKVVYAIGLLLLGGTLVWLIFVKSFAASFAEVDPDFALSLNQSEPTALLTRALKKYSLALISNEPIKSDQKERKKAPQNTISTSSSFDRIETWARSAMNTLPSQQKNQKEGEDLRVQSAPAITFLPKELEEARSDAEMALLLNPLESKSLRLLGQISNLKGAHKETDELMEAALRRSLRESTAAFWLLQDSLDNKDYVRSSELFDVLLRSSSTSQTQALPIFVKFAEIKEAKEEVKKLLASNPAWRNQFFATLPQYQTDPQTPLEYFLALQNTAYPVEEREVSSYLQSLVSKKSYDLAYYAWLQFLPPDELERVNYLYNGGFETIPSGSPFDWKISSGTGTIVEIASLPDQEKQKGLSIQLERGRVDFKPVTQLILLSPGHYQLTGKYKGQLLGKRGLIWRVSCAANPKLLGESSMVVGVAKKWTDFAVEFEVPETDCRAQNVRLELDARSTSEKLVSGSIWYDDVEIVRLDPKKSPSADLTSETSVPPETTGTIETGKLLDVPLSNETPPLTSQASPTPPTSSQDTISRVSETPLMTLDNKKPSTANDASAPTKDLSQERSSLPSMEQSSSEASPPSSTSSDKNNSSPIPETSSTAHNSAASEQKISKSGSSIPSTPSTILRESSKVSNMPSTMEDSKQTSNTTPQKETPSIAKKAATPLPSSPTDTSARSDAPVKEGTPQTSNTTPPKETPSIAKKAATPLASSPTDSSAGSDAPVKEGTPQTSNTTPPKETPLIVKKAGTPLASSPTDTSAGSNAPVKEATPQTSRIKTQKETSPSAKKSPTPLPSSDSNTSSLFSDAPVKEQATQTPAATTPKEKPSSAKKTSTSPSSSPSKTSPPQKATTTQNKLSTKETPITKSDSSELQNNTSSPKKTPPNETTWLTKETPPPANETSSSQNNPTTDVDDIF